MGIDYADDGVIVHLSSMTVDTRSTAITPLPLPVCASIGPVPSHQLRKHLQQTSHQSTSTKPRSDNLMPESSANKPSAYALRLFTQRLTCQNLFLSSPAWLYLTVTSRPLVCTRNFRTDTNI